MIAAHVITFRRNADAAKENGIAIVSEPGLYNAVAIVDSKGLPVAFDDLHSYTLRECWGTIILPSVDL